MRNRWQKPLATAVTGCLIGLSLTALAAAPAQAARPQAPGQAAAPTNPFPTHVTYQVGVMPSASQASRDAAVEKQYDSWKAAYLHHGCAGNEYYVSTKGDNDAPNNGPVSEGQGYGMNIVPLMAGYDADAQSEFNGLWQLVKDHEDQYGLMQWKLDGKTCKYADKGTPDGATDGDLDIGYGLILADKQWGGYSADANAWLAAFYAHDVAPDGHLKCEDDGPNTDTRPSDHMLDHLRAFAAYDTAHDWNKVIQRTEAVDSAFTSASSSSADLLSDFVVGADGANPQPAPADYQENQPDNIVGYNSLRVPWHMGTDALLNGSGTAATEYGFAQAESACLKSLSGGNPANVPPHVNLDCTPYASSDQSEEAGDSVGPAAMAAGDQAWTDAIWNFLPSNPYGDGYYGETIKTLVYLVMAGDYWNPVAGSTPPVGPGGGCGSTQGSAQLLGNPGFENGSSPAPWTQTSTLGQSPVNNDTADEPAHSGSWDAWLNGDGKADTDTISQTVSIPAGCTASLSYWLHVDTTEKTSTAQPDTLKVQLLDASGKVLTAVGSYSNLDKNSGYIQHTADLSAYAGQSVTLRFTGAETDANGGTTSFVIDDTALTTSAGSGPTPGGAGFGQADIDSAVAAAPIAFAAPTSDSPRPGTSPANIDAAKALEYLALVDKMSPDSAASGGTTVDSALLAQVRHLIAGGNEPDADGGLEGWAHASVAQALLLLRNGPAWGELTGDEQNKVSLLEAALGYGGNYTYNDANSVDSGICGFGNFSKTNNPNYRDGYVDVELAAIQFFGASAWDSMLAGFDDATEVSQLDAAGLTNAGGCFSTVGSAANAAIQPPFVYQGHHSGDLMGLWNQLASDTFDKTVSSSNGSAHIADNTTSPEQGKLGMAHEFDSTDSNGLRSSALYSFEGWMNVTGSRLAMTAVGNFSCAAAGAAPQYQVGSADLIYKLRHGYVSYALNQDNVLVDDHGDPAGDGPNAKGYQYDEDAYNAVVATQPC